MFNSDWKNSKCVWIDYFEIINTFLYDFSVFEIYEFLMQVNIFFWIINEFLSEEVILTQDRNLKKMIFDWTSWNARKMRENNKMSQQKK